MESQTFPKVVLLITRPKDSTREGWVCPPPEKPLWNILPTLAPSAQPTRGKRQQARDSSHSQLGYYGEHGEWHHNSRHSQDNNSPGFFIFKSDTCVWSEGAPEWAEAVWPEAEERGRKRHYRVSLSVLALATKGVFFRSHHVPKSWWHFTIRNHKISIIGWALPACLFAVP